jgi:hypothetical protein
MTEDGNASWLKLDQHGTRQSCHELPVKGRGMGKKGGSYLLKNALLECIPIDAILHATQQTGRICVQRESLVCRGQLALQPKFESTTGSCLCALHTRV